MVNEVGAFDLPVLRVAGKMQLLRSAQMNKSPKFRPSLVNVGPTTFSWDGRHILSWSEDGTVRFFEEEQFEGYRRVGEEAMASLFRKELHTDSDDMSAQDWFEKLATQLLPDNDEAFK